MRNIFPTLRRFFSGLGETTINKSHIGIIGPYEWTGTLEIYQCKKYK